jgi:hypothetical protein
MDAPKPQPPKDSNKIIKISNSNQPLLNNEALIKLKASLEEANNEQQIK